jgi:hypothetical protein
MRKLFLASTILVLLHLSANANEVRLDCSLFIVRVDFDNSIIMEFFGPQDIRRYRAAISQEYIEWDNGITRKTINRLTGGLIITWHDGSHPWYRRCVKRDQQF